MLALAVLNEVKPKFPPKVQAIWDDCGTHVTSMEAEIGAKELEHFVEYLIDWIVVECSNSWHEYHTLRSKLISKGYGNE